MSNNQPVYLTAEGMQKVKDELHHLITVKRREVAMMIAEAKAEGDISENAGYDEAKTAQGFLEGKIRDLETVLKNAIVIDDREASKHAVSLGHKVEIRELTEPDIEVYTIVGSHEADPSKGRISNESPMGRALLGKAVGDRVTVSSPRGDHEFEILGIQ